MYSLHSFRFLLINYKTLGALPISYVYREVSLTGDVGITWLSQLLSTIVSVSLSVFTNSGVSII